MTAPFSEPDGRDNLISRSLRYSIYDGLFSAVMISFGESFLIPYAIFLQASNLQIGLLGSLPQALGSIGQLFSMKFLRAIRSRKKLVTRASLLQALMYLPIAAVYFVGDHRAVHLIVFACAYWFFAMILSPAWNSWMGDIVDEGKRGAYFGRRSKLIGVISFASFVCAGIILEQFSGGPTIRYAGFATIFAIALIARLLSCRFLSKQYEPEYTSLPDREPGLRDIVMQPELSDFRILIKYVALMNFAVYLAVPYFIPYMLSDLKLGYLTFTLLQASAVVGKFIFMPVWGNYADRFGAKKILGLSGFLMPLVPILWIVSGKLWYLIVLELYAGFAWAGFEISVLKLMFDTTESSSRSSCMAYYNVITGLSIFAGALTGGLIVRFTDLFWSKYLLVFLISGILRYGASIYILPKMREVKTVESIPYSRLFMKVITAMPTMGLVHNAIPFRKDGNLKK